MTICVRINHSFHRERKTCTLSETRTVLEHFFSPPQPVQLVHWFLLHCLSNSSTTEEENKTELELESEPTLKERAHRLNRSLPTASLFISLWSSFLSSSSSERNFIRTLTTMRARSTRGYPTFSHLPPASLFCHKNFVLNLTRKFPERIPKETSNLIWNSKEHFPVITHFHEISSVNTICQIRLHPFKFDPVEYA